MFYDGPSVGTFVWNKGKMIIADSLCILCSNLSKLYLLYMLRLTQDLIFTVSADKIEKKKKTTGLNLKSINNDNNDDGP